ncbi:rhomboid family intramembrane serine protease [Subtercola frigoramans]
MVTYGIIAATVFVFILQLIPALGVTEALQFAGVYVQNTGYIPVEPWRMLSYAFVHNPFSISSPLSILHIAFNMYSLYIFGRVLEPMIGRWRFLVLYLLSAIGGAVAIDLLTSGMSAVIGASGAIFGLMAATFVIVRKLGGNMSQLVVLVILNLAIGFLVPGISWQAHVGGLVVGALVGVIFMETRQRRQQWLQVGLTAGLFALLIAVTVIRAFV